MKLPDSGSLLSAALGALDPLPQTGHAGVAGVTETQLDDALAALARADIEFVILEEGDDFLQAAGDGDGPYQLEHHAGGALQAVSGGVDRATLGREMQAYRRGDRSWMPLHRWEPAGG